LTASPIPFEPGAFTAPIVDYEPPLIAVIRPTPCSQSPAALYRPPRGPLRPVGRVTVEVAPPPAASEVAPPPAASEVAPPPAAATFADTALRRVLEVIDRRRPIAQLRPVLTPPLLDIVFALTRRAEPDKAAVMQRVRLRTAAVDGQDPREPVAAEVFATYTRGRRVRAIAARVEVKEGRWRVVALQIG
jgi:hypothetical protein